MGPWMMGGRYGMGPWMMGPNGQGGYMMRNWQGWGPPGAPNQGNANLSVGDVKAQLDQYVASMGNPRLKAGPVTPQGNDAFIADVVTAQGNVVVQRFSIDRRTGSWRPVQ